MHMKKITYGIFDIIAKNNGYVDKFDLFRDYGFMPAVLTPKHHKIEIMKLLYDFIKRS